jgi:hypothetical protein
MKQQFDRLSSMLIVLITAQVIFFPAGRNGFKDTLM